MRLGPGSIIQIYVYIRCIDFDARCHVSLLCIDFLKAVPGLTDDVVKTIPKRLVKDIVAFGAKAKEVYEKIPTKERTTLTMEGPANILGLDAVIQEACDQLQSSSLQFMDRHLIVKGFLASAHEKVVNVMNHFVFRLCQGCVYLYCLIVAFVF